ncbi:MAG: TonB-dependent receptor [Chloroflexi bacterium]|nr:TonB-dependent receptor [Chloroflexota bacterium]
MSQGYPSVLSICRSFQFNFVGHLWKCSLLLLLLVRAGLVAAQSFSVSGYVEDAATGERLPRVNLHLVDQRAGASTNDFGYFNLNVPDGVVKISVSHVAYVPQVLEWPVRSDTTLVLLLQPRVATLDSLIVTPELTGVYEGIQMSRHNLSAAQIEDMPAILGEGDVIKAFQFLPGIQPGREGFSGIHVRGGRADQNLILLDGLSLYNPTHVMGLFSVFNPSSLKQVEVLKGGFPARYGGRLSSIIRLTMKEGNMKYFGGEGKLGILTSRLMLEGPIVRDRASWIISARRTFLDQATRWFQPRGEKIGLYFYDLNFKANYIVSKKDRIYLSGYLGEDAYTYRTRPHSGNPTGAESDLRVGWRNRLVSLRWNRLVSDRMFLNLTAGVVGYDIFVQNASRETVFDVKEEYRTSWESSILDYTVRLDAEYKPGLRHYFRFGAEATSHLFIPSSRSDMITSQAIPKSATRSHSRFETGEVALYAEDEVYLPWEIEMNLGLRFSSGQSGGHRTRAIEPRVSLNVPLTSRMDAKASYAFMQQYIHLLAGAGGSLSRETWIPFMPGIDPQKSSQIAIGLAYRFPGQHIGITLEGYYKHLGNQTEYRPDTLPYQATVVGWPSVVEQGQGKAYGVEVLLRRQQRRLRGWVGYTWNRSRRLYDGLNGGDAYPDGYERRHDFSFVSQYQLTEYTMLSASWVYSSGYPIWLPAGRYYDYINVKEWFEYGSINHARVPSTHRLDITARFTKEIKWGKRTLSLGILNVYNRRNPAFVYPKQDYTGVIRWQRLSLVQLVPDVSYGIRF